MMRLQENSKVKRLVSWFLLVSIILTSFITSTTDIAYADGNSNSRRVTSINLAAGVGFGDISNFDDIDEVSLQTIAIYLSNFYLPFITILDGDYSDEELKDSGNTQHVEAMKNALIRNCGFKKDVAEKLVSYVLAQSLSSCKVLYIERDTLERCFNNASDGNGKSYLGFANGAVFAGAFETSASHNGREADAMASSNWYNSSIYYTSTRKSGTTGTVGNTYTWDYITTVGTVSAGDKEYVPVSYAIFIGIMANMYKDKSPDANGLYRTRKMGTKIKFYAMSTSSGSPEMLPVFDSSDECVLMLLHALQYCDVSNGYSNAFMSISSTDVESINNPDITQSSLVTCPNMYVNWEGSLIFDNGVYRTVVLPGCMNPYMVESWTGSEYEPALNFINNTSLSTLGLGVMSKSNTISIGRSCYWDWRVTIGSDERNFDKSWNPFAGWGENQSIFDLLQSLAYVDSTGASGGDYAKFPVLTQRLFNDRCWTSSDGKFGIYGWAADHSGWENENSVNIVWYDSFSPITADTTLSGLFKQQNVFDSTFVSTLKELNLDTYAQFKNIKKQGHSLEYPKSTQKLFQAMYLTYCFAAFNADYTTYDVDTNIVPIKLNLANFPKADVEIDFSAEQADVLTEQIMSFVYYLLHPTEGVAYVAKLFKNKVSGILLSWHEDIVGATSSNSATGMTKYLGTSSYTTMPNLKDISWVSGLLNIYNNIIVYLIILMCLILLCYVLTGSMTIQRGVVGVVLFGICAFLPPFAINMAVDTINTVSDSVFSEKFDFWAICQMQNFVDEYQKAMEAQGSGNFSSYASFVLSTQSSDISAVGDDEESSVSFSGTKVKWMAPKKYNSLASLVQAVNEGTAMGNSSASFLQNTILNMVAKSTSGETYLEATDSLYLYRDYTDIFKYAHTSYNILSTFNYNGKLGKDGETEWISQGRPLRFYINGSSDSSYYRAWNGMTDVNEVPVMEYISSSVSTTSSTKATYETSSIAHIAKGYLYNTVEYVPSSTTTSYSYFYTKSGAQRNTLAVSYLANYTKTFREVHEGLNNLRKIANGMSGIAVSVGDPTSTYYNFGLPKAAKDASVNGSYMLGYQEIIGLTKTDMPKTPNECAKVYKDLSDIFYGLYSESPFYYFNANIRDQANSTDFSGDSYMYDYDNLNRGKIETSDGKMNHIAKMFLSNNQEYFFNLVSSAGDGYGELRDFTNMHDFFYFVIPYLREGVELARLYDELFGLYTDDDCSLIVNADGSCMYDGTSFKDLNELKTNVLDVGDYTDEELYKLWHTYNTYTILSAYTPWIDTMLDCDYSKPETITVMGDRFKVYDPINPRSYYQVDSSGNLVAGRYMVFSKSEMNAMGLTTADLTTVERKIIEFQDNVYHNTLNLMNYYTFSDEVMIQAYAMLQTFEFNKLFSQTSLFSEDFVMYPQGYELKGFSYDAYLRMVVSNASGESLMFNGDSGNVSIYERVMKNTSLFFGIFLLINDILAVYVIPGLKIFFLVTIFICSILILVGSVIKMEMNIFSVLWKSLIAPLLSFSAICIGLSVIVSMFMKTGANGVASSEFVISVGDPTAAIILMIILNVLVVILMWKICKKCFRDLITYGKAVFDNIGSTVVGAVGALGAGFAGGRAIDKFRSGSSGGSGVSRTAKQRGKDNDPRSGRNGIGAGGLLAAGAGGAALGLAAGAGGDGAGGLTSADMSDRERQRLRDKQSRDEATVGMNKYDKKAYNGATAKQDIARDKATRDAEMAANSKGLRKKRYEMAEKLHTRQAESAAIKADNVKKYGTGARSTIEGMKSIGGKGRRSRLEQLGGVSGVMGDYNASRIAASKSDKTASPSGKTSSARQQSSNVVGAKRGGTGGSAQYNSRANSGASKKGSGKKKTNVPKKSRQNGNKKKQVNVGKARGSSKAPKKK